MPTKFQFQWEQKSSQVYEYIYNWWNMELSHYSFKIICLDTVLELVPGTSSLHTTHQHLFHHHEIRRCQTTQIQAQSLVSSMLWTTKCCCDQQSGCVTSSTCCSMIGPPCTKYGNTTSCSTRNAWKKFHSILSRVGRQFFFAEFFFA